MNTKRAYIIAFIEGFHTQTNFLTIEMIFEQDRDEEYIFAIRENIDAILDLKDGERLLMAFNRDNEDSFGFIKRTR